MPLDRHSSPSRLVRLVSAVGGPTTIRMRCAPRFHYARAHHSTSVSGYTAEFCSEHGDRLRLTSTVPLTTDGNDVLADASLPAGKRAAFVLEQQLTARVERWDVRRAARASRATIVRWRRWIAACAYRGHWSAEVRRSALALALLHSRRTGAVIAAPTFGLPEQIGGERNWDFRFAWIRDASFILFALTRLGLRLDGTPFASWITQRCAEAENAGELQSVYGIDGRRVLTEQTLDHLDGYRSSRPVRVGNAAYEQFQLDVYGELIDALFALDKHRGGTSRALWDRIVELTNWVCEHWTRADHGIWEVRGGPQEFLYSRVMCWVGVDRALRMGRRRRFPAPIERWGATREAIHRDVHANFWNSELGAFVGSRGANAMDAACLIMPIVGFIRATDPRWLGTLRRIEERLVHDGLVRRYELTGMDTAAGSIDAPSFTVCSFWYVECLALAGRGEEASRAMERLVARANHLGLYSEDLGTDGALLGNFPQGLTHLGLIGAAVSLEVERT
jgi:GH15 family glucan-1,4-alpha-glucosidase